MATESKSGNQLGELTRLAQDKFGPLSDAEILLLEKIPVGEEAKCSALDDKGDDVKAADSWTEKRKVRAEVLCWICMDGEARKHIHWRGIRIYGADVIDPLELSYVTIPFPLIFNHCRFKEPIVLSGSELSELEFPGSTVNYLKADGLIVKYCLFLRDGFVANSEVRLRRVQIGVDLGCDGTFTAPRQEDSRPTNLAERGKPEIDTALSAQGIVVKGAVFLSNNFAATGEVDFTSAQIGGPLVCTADFKNATLKLTDASSSTLWDEGATWPPESKLDLDGFAYGRISSSKPIDVDARLGWLALQSKTPFHSRSYLQLAKVLRESGDSKGALRVLQRMEKLRRCVEGSAPWRGAPRLSFIKRWATASWSAILRWTIGYGYRPAIAVWWLIFLILLGWAVFGYSASTMVPTDKDAYSDLKGGNARPAHYPTFSPAVYSLENSLPLVKLGQTEKWQPDPATHVLIWFVRGQILLGWFLATFFLAGISGIVHKE